MANSSAVSEIKERVITAMTKDDAIVNAFGADDIENGGDLIDTHIFRYNKNPETIDRVLTFVTVMVNITVNDYNKTRVIPTLEIWIYTHNDHMDMGLKDIRDNRNDYMSRLLDDKFNNTYEYGGVGKLTLKYNDEGAYNSKFLYRRMVFETTDLNDSLCESW